MKATSIKQYQHKFQPDMSLYMKTSWTEWKAQISKKKSQAKILFGILL